MLTQSRVTSISGKKIKINEPDVGKDEEEAVLSVLRSKVFSNASTAGGPRVQEFERQLRNHVGTRFAVAVNSGTAALYAALAALGVEKGDEVLLPSFTFVATANAVVSLGATPSFVDIEKDDFTVSVQDLESKISKASKAIIPVHLYGYPAKMEEVGKVATERGIEVVEDAAQSIGSTYRGKQTGALGKCGCFSLYASKVVMSGEGGAITTNDPQMSEKLRLIRTHGMSSPYVTERLGFNLRMPEIEAALGVCQMKKLPRFLGKRAQNAAILREELSNVEGMKLPPKDDERKNNYYLFTISVTKKRDRIMEQLERRGIEARVFYPLPIHRTPFYLKMQLRNNILPNTEWASAHVLSLPVHQNLSEDQMIFIAKETKTAVRQIV